MGNMGPLPYLCNTGIQKVLEKNDDIEDDLATLQRNIENAAGSMVRNTKAEREQIMMSTPENVPLRGEAAARGKYSRSKPRKPEQSTK